MCYCVFNLYVGGFDSKVIVCDFVFIRFVVVLWDCFMKFKVILSDFFIVEICEFVIVD